MTGKASLDRSTAAPDAALVHLSGHRRGATEFLSGDRIALVRSARIAHSQREILPVLEARGEVDFWEVARVLADGGHIAPLATRGIVGQITAASIVYDADTTHGGSGGPVISLDGAVVAVNAAILTSFAGSNLGVPAAEALRLLVPPPETT